MEKEIGKVISEYGNRHETRLSLHLTVDEIKNSNPKPIYELQLQIRNQRRETISSVTLNRFADKEIIACLFRRTKLEA
jgi:hypothetical protein